MQFLKISNSIRQKLQTHMNKPEAFTQKPINHAQESVFLQNPYGFSIHRSINVTQVEIAKIFNVQNKLQLLMLALANRMDIRPSLASPMALGHVLFWPGVLQWLLADLLAENEFSSNQAIFWPFNLLALFIGNVFSNTTWLKKQIFFTRESRLW